MSKILILGGLGYVGSALCELYAERPQDEVLVVDNRFVPERVAGFPAHFRFLQGDINDLELMARLTAKADIVHFLAAQVEAESSAERSEAVWRDNFSVPKLVMEACPPSVRILFPSSGNVFGGAPEDGKFMDLNEEDEPAPRLPYAEAKHAVELFLKGSNRNFTILRFGTNYGYAPGVRFNLVTNIFTQRALAGEDLKLHGGGLNWRPTACVKDCARALLFTAHNPSAAGELYHVVQQSYRICDLAQKVVDICNTGAKVVTIDKKVPFNSYALSSQKLQKAGFRFEWPLERAIADMRDCLRAVTSAAQA